MHQETRVMGLLCDEGCVRDPNFNRLRLIHPCDGRTDRRTGFVGHSIHGAGHYSSMPGSPGCDHLYGVTRGHVQ